MGIACYKINSSKGYFQEKKAITNHEKFAYEQIFDCLDKDCGDFNADYEADNEDYHFTANVFNFLTLCHDEFTIDTRSMKFLVQQGFDLNELSLKGIPYYRGNDVSFCYCQCFRLIRVEFFFLDIVGRNRPIITKTYVRDNCF